jgi:hypothetical protein
MDLERDTNNIALLLKLLAEINSGHSFHGEINQDLLAFLWFKGKRDGFYIDSNYRSNVLGAGKVGVHGLHFPPNNVQDKRPIFFRLIYFVRVICTVTIFLKNPG